jgi:hypothetical protein
MTFGMLTAAFVWWFRNWQFETFYFDTYYLNPFGSLSFLTSQGDFFILNIAIGKFSRLRLWDMVVWKRV